MPTRRQTHAPLAPGRGRPAVAALLALLAVAAGPAGAQVAPQPGRVGPGAEGEEPELVRSDL